MHEFSKECFTWNILFLFRADFGFWKNKLKAWDIKTLLSLGLSKVWKEGGMVLPFKFFSVSLALRETVEKTHNVDLAMLAVF